MEALKTKIATREALETTIACMVMGDMDNAMIMKSVQKIFDLSPLETLQTMDIIRADRMMKALVCDTMESEFANRVEPIRLDDGIEM